MTEVMAEPLAAAIRRRGSVVETGAEVRGLRIAQGKVTGVELADRTIAANAVVVATSLRPAQELLKPLSDHPWFAPAFPRHDGGSRARRPARRAGGDGSEAPSVMARARGRGPPACGSAGGSRDGTSGAFAGRSGRAFDAQGTPGGGGAD